jgi:ribosomal protein S14
MVELDKSIEGKKIIYTETPKGKKAKKVIVNCSKCGVERAIYVHKWVRRNSDLCRKCFPSEVSSQSFRHITHGLSKHPLYQTYNNMLRRCTVETSNNYKYYGGKGITVFEPWLNKEKGLQMFFAWAISKGWKEGLQIDRIDNSGNYCPDNCQFISQLENLQKMENLFGVKGRCVKKGVVSTDLIVDAPEEVEKFKKLDEYNFITSSDEEDIENFTLGC